MPKSLSVEKKEDCFQINWQQPDIAVDGDTAKYFVIYMSTSNGDIDLDDPRNILTIVEGSVTEFVHLSEFDDEEQFTFAISSLDKLQNESIENPVLIIR